MMKIPNNVVKDLIKLLPVLIENVPHSNNNTRLANTIRRVGIIVKKLKKLENINIENK